MKNILLLLCCLLFVVSVHAQTLTLKKITELPSASTIDSGDVFPFSDVSTSKTKKITHYDLFNEIDSLITALGDSVTSLRLVNNALSDSLQTLRDLIQGDTTIVPPEVELDYYVNSVSGNDASDGQTKATAWRTISKVNNTPIDSGLTVGYLGEAVHSDTSLVCQNGVTYTSYNEGKAIFRLEPFTSTNFAVIVHEDNVRISQFDIQSKYWIDFKGSSGFICDSTDGSFYSTYMPEYGTGCLYADYTADLNATFRHCDFTGGFSTSGDLSDMLNLKGSSKVYAYKTTFKNIDHSLLGTGEAGYASDLYFDECRFYNQYHHAAYVYNGEDSNIVFQNCYFENAGNGQYGSNNPTEYNGELGALSLDGHGNIFRNNVVKEHGAMRKKWNYVPMFSILNDSWENSVYGNTFYSSKGAVGFRFGLDTSATRNLSDNYFINNAFIKVGDSTWNTYYTGMNADSVAVMVLDEDPDYGFSGNYFQHNCFFGTDSTVYHYNLSQFVNNNYASWSGVTFADNISTASIPLANPTDSLTVFDKENMYDSLRILFEPQTVLVDAGMHLTQVNEPSGSSDNIFVVDNSRLFSAGITGLVQGDSLCITDDVALTKQYTRITSINHSSKAITVSGSITVTDNDYVDLVNSATGEAYQGTTNDIGAFEELP